MASPPMSKRQKLDISEDRNLIAYIDLLPNEMLELIFKMAMGNMTTQKRYDFLVDVIPNVSSKFRSLSSVKSLWSGLAPLEMLLNEVAEIPIKMWMNNLEVYQRHDYIVDVISKVSTRLKTLATSKSLWKGAVYVRGNDKKIKQVINEFLNEGVTKLFMSDIWGNEVFMSPEDILDIFSKCPKLTELGINTQRGQILAWPNFPVPCTTLERLWLWTVTSDMFEGVDLHKSLPNLKYFSIHNYNNAPHVLPGMSKCKNLREVWLVDGKFKIAGIPRGLKSLKCISLRTPTIVGIDRASLEAQFEKCDIDSKIKFQSS